MILHRYDQTGLFIVSVEHPDNEPIPLLATFLAPPITVPNVAPFAVFRGGVWHLDRVKPTTVIHSSLSPNTVLESFQAKAVLAQYGLLETVQTLIDSPSTPIKVKLAWENAVPFRRDNLLVLLIVEQLKLPVTLVDELFSVGALITPETL